jgi:hypothetical protein
VSNERLNWKSGVEGKGCERAAARDYKETAALSAVPKGTVVYERSDGAG